MEINISLIPFNAPGSQVVRRSLTSAGLKLGIVGPPAPAPAPPIPYALRLLFVLSPLERNLTAAGLKPAR